jgi:hypothetical protein
MFNPRERGKAQSLYGLGPLLGPVVGTIAGGWICQNLHSWRWLLGILTILSAAILSVVLVSLRETYGPVLLRRKIRRVALAHLRDMQDQEPDENAEEREAWKAHCLEVEKLALPPPPVSYTALPPWANKIVAVVIPSRALLIKLRLAFSRPFRLLFFNPICAIFSLYMGFIYGIIFIFITQHPLIFEKRGDLPNGPPTQRLPTYGWKIGIASLSYLGLGLGFIAAAAINILLQDVIYARLVLSNGKLGWFLFTSRANIVEHMAKAKQAAEVGDAEAVQEGPPTGTGFSVEKATIPSGTPPIPGKGQPEYRLPLCLLGMFILPGGLFLFGWTADRHQCSFIFPLIGSFFVGMGSILPFQSILVYLVDAFIPYSASATACAVLVRCVLAAAFPLFSQQLFVAIGYGWGSSLLAFISMLAIPVPLVLYRYGEAIRTRFKFEG